MARLCYRSTVKRRLLIAVVFLLAGAVVNVAVAWLLAAVVEPSSDPEMVLDFPDPDARCLWVVTAARGWGSLVISAAMPSLGSSDPVDIDDPRIPSWSRVQHLSAYQQGEPMPMIFDLAFGWPFLSMWLSVDATRDSDTGAVIQRTTSGAVSEFEFPIRILWLGFAVNTFLYAALLWLPFVVRRFVRVRRGLCPKCAYPIGESAVCTECGKALPRRARTAT